MQKYKEINMKKGIIIIFLIATIIITGCETTGQLIVRHTCKDSDGGMVYHLRGSVEGIDGRYGQYSYEDVCLNNRTLKEYYCGGATAHFHQYTCSNPGHNPDPARCFAGRCIDNKP